MDALFGGGFKEGVPVLLNPSKTLFIVVLYKTVSLRKGRYVCVGVLNTV